MQLLWPSSVCPVTVCQRLPSFTPRVQLITWLKNDPSGAPLIVLDEVRQHSMLNDYIP